MTSLIVLAPAVFLVAAVLVEVGIPIGVGLFFGQVVVGASLLVGLSYAQQALARSLSDRASGGFGGVSPAVINSPEVRGNVKQAVPDQRIIFGTTRIGGALYLYEVKPPYLYVGFVYSSLPITRYLNLYLGERRLTLPAIPENQIFSPLQVSGEPNYPGRLSICVQRGTLNQGINALIASDFPEFGSRFMTPGLPNAVFKCHYGNDQDEFLALWGNVQIPDFQWVVEGVPLPDPRVPSCRLDFDPTDAEDLHAALQTFVFSENAALAQAFWAMMPMGLRATPQRIDWDSVTEAADFDDEPVGLADGEYQRRHTVSGVVLLSDKPNVVMEAMHTANRGFAVQRAGRFSIYSSQPREPVFTITDSMLVGGFEFRRLKPKKELLNIARCKFIAPDREYQDADGPVLRRDDLIDKDGQELEHTVRLAFTSTHQRAQRILKGYLREARLDRYLVCQLSMKAYGLREGMIVRRHSETGRYSEQDGLYSVEEWRLEPNMSAISVSLAEYDPTISRDWDPASDEQPFELEVA